MSRNTVIHALHHPLGDRVGQGVEVERTKVKKGERVVGRMEVGTTSERTRSSVPVTVESRKRGRVLREESLKVHQEGK